MTATLTTLSARVSTYLMDPNNLVWASGDITEAIRLALGEYSLAAQTAYTLNGLDSATTTSYPDLHEFLMVIGAAGYAATARGIDRSEGFDEDKESATLSAWGKQRLADFRNYLVMTFPGYSPSATPDPSTPSPAEADRRAEFRTTSNPAWAAWTDDSIEYGEGYDRS